MTPQDILNLRVRNAEGQMVPFSAFTEVSWEAGPPSVQRYNGYPAMTISGNAAPGYSSGEAMAEMERLAEQLPEGFRSEEHTSELQSLMRISYSVSCLKKKKKINKLNNTQ